MGRAGETAFEQANPQKTLGDVCSRTFLFLATFRAAPPDISADEAALALQAVWREEEADSRSSADLYTSYERAKYLLVVCADELMRSAPNWAGATSWPSQEAALFGTSIGGERFFDLMEEPTYRSPELSEVFFQALALGFQGAHAGDSNTLGDIRRKLRYQLEGVPSDLSERLTPNVYEETRDDDFTAMPVASSLRLAVILGGVVLTLGLLAKVAYATSVSKLIDKTNAIASPLDGLDNR